jgi:uroporphyrinogen decarboxylase
LFTPDYSLILDAVRNVKPQRLPIYEHIISPAIMERILDHKFSELEEGEDTDLVEYFRHYCRFFKEMTYDAVSFEAGIVDIMPDSGAIYGGRPGPIQNREDFEKYPWQEIPERFWLEYERHFEALCGCLPAAMKAVGGVGYGVFEISEDLVGYEYLSYMQADDPGLFADLYDRIGELMFSIWSRFLERWGEHFAVCRMGDDLGYKTGLLAAPDTIRSFVIPQYRKLIDLIHSAKKPFLWHSCGRIFEIMDDMIEAGIDAKHSNEDVIAPFDEWIELYGDRIGLLGGIDMDLLCREKPDQITRIVVEEGRRFRNKAKGYALGSGNSIPDYVPAESYLAMIEGVKKLRNEETV